MILKIAESLEEENIRLKKKVNQLITLIQEGQKTQQPPTAKTVEKEAYKNVENGQEDMLPILQKIFQKTEAEKRLIPYEKSNKNAKEFVKISKPDFTRILAEYFLEDRGKKKEELYRFLSACGIIKTQVNGKYFWSDLKDGERIKILQVRKSAYQYFLSR